MISSLHDFWSDRMRLYLSMMDQVNNYLRFLLFMIVAAILICLGLQVLTRYVIEQPLSWTGEVSRYLMVWMTFIGASLCIRHHRLIRVEVILMKLKPKQIMFIHMFAGVVSIFFYGMLIYLGIQITGILSLQQSPALQIPMYIPYLSVPIGGFLMICNTIAALIDSYLSIEGGPESS